MENIARFGQAARAYGLSDSETFQTVDLFEKMNLHQVVLCIFALGRKVMSVDDHASDLIDLLLGSKARSTWVRAQGK